MVSAGDRVSVMRVKPRMSENITLASTCLPPRVTPVVSSSSATSAVANFRNSSRCWSRRRFLLEAGPDPGAQQHRVHRLEQVVLRAHLDAPGHAVHLLDRGHHDHREVPQARVGREGGQHLVAVHLRHLDVEQDQVDRALGAALTRASRPFSAERHGVPELLEGAAEQEAVDPVVVDDEEVAAWGRYAVRSRRRSPSARAARS